DYAVQNSPSIKIARQKWESTVEKYPVATSLPDPQFMATYFPRPIETRMGPQDWNASISQMIPFPGKLSTSGRVVEIEAAEAKLKTDGAARVLSSKVAASFYELLYIRQAIEITQKNLELIEELRLLAETGHAENKAVFIDVIKAQSKVGQIRYDMILLKELEQTEVTTLNGLLNRPADAFIGELYSPELPLLDCPVERLYKMAEDNQEEIAISRLNVKKAEIGVEMAGYVNKPDFKVGLFYAVIGEPDVSMPPPDAGKDSVGIQFGVNLPIWGGKNRSVIAQAKSMVAQANASSENIANTVRTKIRTLYFKLNNSMRLISLYTEELLPQAQQSMELAGTWFREGRGTFSDFVEVQASVYNFQLSIARAKADYGKSLALLQTLVGQPVDGGCDNMNSISKKGVRHED
ncbi:MAG: TolC family protein, partial [Desulfamplus sp.]|nr:TolC family protein [Desulfamplus sp.]